eukprot:6201255-Pleurochrysis_carterae.AAC.4
MEDVLSGIYARSLKSRCTLDPGDARSSLQCICRLSSVCAHEAPAALRFALSLQSSRVSVSTNDI